MTKTSWIHREKRQIPYMNVKVKGHVLYSYVQFGSSRSWSLISGVPRNILEFYSFGIHFNVWLMHFEDKHRQKYNHVTPPAHGKTASYNINRSYNLLHKINKEHHK